MSASLIIIHILIIGIFFFPLVAPKADDQITDRLVWHNISQPFTRGALCNDFTGAGYFIRKEPDSESGSGFDQNGTLNPDWDLTKNQGSQRSNEVKENKWVIFLEGGGGCTTPISCNERFIEHRIRNQYRVFQNGTLKVDVAKAWNAHKDKPLQVTSKLMTTLWTFSPWGAGGNDDTSSSNNPPSEQIWTIEGRNILSTSPAENPDFYNHHHVLVPYCSSDLWLKKTNNYRKVYSKNFAFEFRPEFTEEHQFTFRGAVIFQSLIEDLYEFHGFEKVTQVVLAGSSAGGVGALNHAYWLKRQLGVRGHPRGKECLLRVLLDSSWFIDFKGEIGIQFAPSDLNDLVESNEIIETCSLVDNEYARNNTKRVGGEASQQLTDETSSINCLSAPLLLSSGKFPTDVPLLTIFSRYDLYLLVRSLASSASIGEV